MAPFPTAVSDVHGSSEVVRPRLGLAAAVAVVVIWSGWLVATRAGATSVLTLYDITALRFGISGLVALPIVLWFRPWRGMPLRRIAVLSMVAGTPYVLIAYAAFTYAPAAHGGIFMNGVLPALTLALGWVCFRESPHRLQLAGTVLIIIAAAMAAADAGQTSAPGAWRGDLLFLLAGLCFAGYMVLNRLWNLTVMQVLMSVPVVNGLVYVPIWAVFLASYFWLGKWAREVLRGVIVREVLRQTFVQQILLQALYQGLLPNLVGLLLVSVAVRHAGASLTAAFMTAVPALGALLGIVFLGEVPGWLGWTSLVVLTPGIILTAVWKPRRRG